MNFGVTLSDLGEFDEALVWIRESLRLLPDTPDSHVNLGMTLARQGEPGRGAPIAMSRPSSLRPDFPEATAESCLYLAGSRRLRAWMAGARMAAEMREAVAC